MQERINEPVDSWKAVFAPGYRLIVLGAAIGGYQIFQVMLDIKKLGMEWLDKSSSTWQWYLLLVWKRSLW